MAITSLAFGSDFVLTPLYDPTDPLFAGIQNPFVVKVNKAKLIGVRDSHAKLPVYLYSGSEASKNAVYCAVDNKDIYLLYTANMMMPYSPYGNEDTNNTTPYKGNHRQCFRMADVGSIQTIGGYPWMKVTDSGNKYCPYLTETSTVEFSLTAVDTPIPPKGSYTKIAFCVNQTKRSFKLTHPPSVTTMLAHSDEWVTTGTDSSSEWYLNLITPWSAGPAVTTATSVTSTSPILIQIPLACTVHMFMTDRTFAVTGRPSTTEPDAMLLESRMGSWITKDTRTRVDLMGWNTRTTKYELLIDVPSSRGTTYSTLDAAYLADHIEKVVVPQVGGTAGAISVSIINEKVKPFIENIADSTKLTQSIADLRAFTEQTNYDSQSDALLNTIATMMDKVVTTYSQNQQDVIPRTQFISGLVLTAVGVGGLAWLMFKGR